MSGLERKIKIKEVLRIVNKYKKIIGQPSYEARLKLGIYEAPLALYDGILSEIMYLTHVQKKRLRGIKIYKESSLIIYHCIIEKTEFSNITLTVYYSLLRKKLVRKEQPSKAFVKFTYYILLAYLLEKSKFEIDIVFKNYNTFFFNNFNELGEAFLNNNPDYLFNVQQKSIILTRYKIIRTGWDDKIFEKYIRYFSKITPEYYEIVVLLYATSLGGEKIKYLKTKVPWWDENKLLKIFPNYYTIFRFNHVPMRFVNDVVDAYDYIQKYNGDYVIFEDFLKSYKK